MDKRNYSVLGPHAFPSMQYEQSQAEPHSWPHAQGLNQMTLQGLF